MLKALLLFEKGLLFNLLSSLRLLLLQVTLLFILGLPLLGFNHLLHRCVFEILLLLLDMHVILLIPLLLLYIVCLVAHLLLSGLDISLHIGLELFLHHSILLLTSHFFFFQLTLTLHLSLEALLVTHSLGDDVLGTFLGLINLFPSLLLLLS